MRIETKYRRLRSKASGFGEFVGPWRALETWGRGVELAEAAMLVPWYVDCGIGPAPTVIFAGASANLVNL